jgi:hypothetical protein
MVAVTAPVGIANVAGGVTVVAFAVGSTSSRSGLACVGTRSRRYLIRSPESSWGSHTRSITLSVLPRPLRSLTLVHSNTTSTDEPAGS